METYAKDGKPILKPVGSGYFPVINPDTGYYISGTSLAADGSASAYSSNHYLDSSVVPYAVWANHWDHISLGGKKLRMGDFGLAIENNTGASIGFVYGDGGTPDKVGECSQKLHNTLGRGAGLVTFIAFPGSGSGQILHGRYIPSPLGPHPHMVIPIMVLKHTLRLHTNAADLAARLSVGRELSAPAGTTNPSPDQARLYKNFMSALSAWTNSALVGAGRGSLPANSGFPADKRPAARPRQAPPVRPQARARRTGGSWVGLDRNAPQRRRVARRTAVLGSVAYTQQKPSEAVSGAGVGLLRAALHSLLASFCDTETIAPSRSAKQ